MGLDGEGGGSGRDLVVIALPSVQRFIEEARTTSDVAAASAIYSALAREVVGSFSREAANGEIVLPAASPEGSAAGMPNRVVALFPEGTGARAAKDAYESVHAAWRAMVAEAFGKPMADTPGFPVVLWACVSPGEPGGNGYKAQWETAQRLLAARRRLRDFAPPPEDGWRQRDICALSPCWPAERNAPPRTPRHDKDAKLSAVAWVKRNWRRVRDEPGFPSTASIASAPYRQAVLLALANGNATGRAGEDVARAVVALEKAAAEAGLTGGPREAAVPGLEEVMPARGTGRWLGSRGGPWVYPERWTRESLARESEIADAAERLDELARAGAKAARDLRTAMGIQLAGYLAVVVQDVDSMGRFLGGDAAAADGGAIEVTAGEHSRVSRLLGGLAEAQRRALATAGLLGVPVYSGGDDLLLFTPAATALAAAETANKAIPQSLPTASTAVLYFHYHASIQQAMSTARHLLEMGKEKVPGKHALAVGYLRRSGASESCIQPWPGPNGASSAALLQVFTRDAEHRLSPRLVADLERDAGELGALLKVSERVYRAELARLVSRHTSDRHAGSAVAAAEALHWLGRNEAALDGARSPHAAAKVGVFLRQEAR